MLSPVWTSLYCDYHLSFLLVPAYSGFAFLSTFHIPKRIRSSFALFPTPHCRYSLPNPLAFKFKLTVSLFGNHGKCAACNDC